MGESVIREAEEENLGVKLSSGLEVKGSVERLEKKWEGVEVRSHAVETHTVIDVGGRMELRSSHDEDISSNYGVPDEGFKRWVCEMKSWVRERDEFLSR